MKTAIKHFSNFALILVLCFTTVGLTAQNILSPVQWQQDLDKLQETVHTDYPFLFKKVTAEDFDTEVKKLRAAIPKMEDHEVVIGLMRIVSLFKYGHTDMGFTSDLLSYHKLPINVYQFKDGMYIEGAHSQYKKIIGAKVIEVEGVPIEKVLTKIRPTVPAENNQYFKAFGINNLRIPEVLHAQGITETLKMDIELTLEKGGKTFTHTVTAMKSEDVPNTSYSMVNVENDWLSARSQDNTPLYLKDLDKNFYYTYLPEQKVVYVRHSKVRNGEDESVAKFFGRVFEFVEANDVEKFVLDVRLNGGGNNYLNKPVITGIIKSKINESAKFYTIIGRRTFSACQNLINEIDNYTNVTFVGEGSSENINFYGDTRKLELPNSKLPVYLSFAWWQDKPQWENRDGSVPEIPVEMTFNQYVTNQDPVLDIILSNNANTKVLTDPMGRLTELFMAGKMEDVQKEAANMVEDSAYSSYDFKGEFIKIGNRLLENGNSQGGLFVLQLAADLYPTSGDALLLLAQGLQKENQLEKAKAFYTKVIRLDKNSTWAETARAALAEIKKNK